MVISQLTPNVLRAKVNINDVIKNAKDLKKEKKKFCRKCYNCEREGHRSYECKKHQRRSKKASEKEEDDLVLHTIIEKK